MMFEMWGIWHILYMISPLIILLPLYFWLRNKSDRLKYWVGVVIGIISLSIIVTRNVDIISRNGFDPQAIPLQVCHFGNIMVFFALLTKNKTLAAVAFCLNFPFAFSSLIEAENLVGYSPITWTHIRAQAYIWGHLFIVVGSIYPVIVGSIRFKFKHLLKAMAVVFGLFMVAMPMNLILNGLGYSINYFYAFDSGGVPFKMFENLAPTLDIMFKNTTNLFVAWDYTYTLCVFALGVISMLLMFGLSRLMYKLADKK